METRVINRDVVKPESVTVDDKQRHRIRADVTPYGVFDTYQTRWIPGVWKRSLENWPPPMAWSHQWHEPIGKLVDYSDDHNRLQTLHELDDFDAVPRAKQAWSQLNSGTISNFSFGFDTVTKEPAKDREGGYDMLDCDLDEVSPVLRGAVPGTKYVGSRSQDAGLLAVARQLERGNMTLEEALATVIRAADLNSADQRGLHSHAKQDGSGMVQHSHAGDVGMHAHSGLMPVLNGRADEPEQTRADAKFAMEDGSFPINNCADVSDAAKLAHNSKTYSFEQVKAHVLRAKKALDCPDDVIPASWADTGRSDEDIAAARQLLNDVARR